MKKFLIIQTAFIGDAILVSSLLEKIHTYYPDSEIQLLVKKGNEGIYSNHPFLKKVWAFDKSKKIRSFFQLIKSLRTIDFDYIINCHRFFSSGLITLLIKGKNKIGFDKNPLSLFYSEKHKHNISTKAGLHEIERNHQLIRSITDDIPAKPKLYPNTRKDKNLVEVKDYICIAPGSVWYTKQLPIYQWLELIKKIPESKTIYLLGSKNEYLLSEELIQKSSRKNIFNKCGNFSLLESAAIMKEAAMNYVNDSAPLHLCSGVNAPVTVFFCSTVPEFGFGPLSDVNYIYEVKNLDCRPCGIHGYSKCPKGHFKCSEINLDKISV